MKCPLWSIFYSSETDCREKDCGMYLICRPVLQEELRPFDECPNGHKNSADVSDSDTPEGCMEMICLEDGCDERWVVPRGGK